MTDSILMHVINAISPFVFVVVGWYVAPSINRFLGFSDEDFQ